MRSVHMGALFASVLSISAPTACAQAPVVTEGMVAEQVGRCLKWEPDAGVMARREYEHPDTDKIHQPRIADTATKILSAKQVEFVQVELVGGKLTCKGEVRRPTDEERVAPPDSRKVMVCINPVKDHCNAYAFQRVSAKDSPIYSFVAETAIVLRPW